MATSSAPSSTRRCSIWWCRPEAGVTIALSYRQGDFMRVLMARFGLCAAMLLGLPVLSMAQTAMPKLIKIIVPFSPGASNDAVARAIAVPLAQRLQATVIVENKAGAAGTIGADAVAKSPHDGSVLLLTSSTFLT